MECKREEEGIKRLPTGFPLQGSGFRVQDSEFRVYVSLQVCLFTAGEGFGIRA
jgi:hypothetical protein